MRNLLKNLLERRCQACAAPMLSSGYRSAAEDFCPKCAKLLKPVEKGFCPVCGEIFGGAGEGLCPGCQNSRPPWGRVFFYGAYSGQLRELVHRLKFGRALHLATALGKLVAQNPEFGDSTKFYAAVVPVPLHDSRLSERGFNQSLEIARPLARKLQIPVGNLLERTSPTRHQTGLSREQRLKNVRGAFKPMGDLVGKKLLLVDDVMTTGATLSVASKALLSAGAAEVDIAVVARTPAKNMLLAVRQE